LDAPYPTITGGLYVQSRRGVEVSFDAGDNAVLAYKSSLLTTKVNDTWAFNFEVAEFEDLNLTVSLPTDVKIRYIGEGGSISDTPQSKDISWRLAGAKNLTLEYYFTAETSFEKEEDSILPDAKDKAVDHTVLVLVLLSSIIVLVVGTAIIYFVWKRARTKQIQSKMMETLSENEGHIVAILLENGGGMKRNELERVSKMAKSSLAGVVHNLERKSIITVDRRYNTHYIELTKTFKEP
jgi:uncharacterized membrane protein